MNILGHIRWPPSCNLLDSKAPPKNYGANLTQFKPALLDDSSKKPKGNQHKKKQNGNGQQRRQSTKKNGARGWKPKTWMTVRPTQGMLEKHKNRVPVCSQVKDGRKFYWCRKCDDGQGKWVTSHHTGSHQADYHLNCKNRNRSHGQVNMGEGLAPQMNLWMAKVNPSKLTIKRNLHNQPRRQSRKQFGAQFNNVHSWFRKRQRRHNQLKHLDEPPAKT